MTHVESVKGEQIRMFAVKHMCRLMQRLNRPEEGDAVVLEE